MAKLFREFDAAPRLKREAGSWKNREMSAEMSEDVFPVLRRLGRPSFAGLVPDGLSRSADSPAIAEEALTAVYVLQGAPSLAEAAEALVIEESTGMRFPGPDAVARVGGQVLDVAVAGVYPLATLSAPLARAGVTTAEVGRVTVSWPAENVGCVPSLLTMVLGEANETGMFAACRLVGLALPDAVLDCFSGPSFGMQGVCQAIGVRHRPLVGAIVKPSTGLTPEEHARVARELAMGGADFVKDDELLMDPPHCRFSERVQQAEKWLTEVAVATGRRPFYAPNATGGLAGLRERLALASHAGCGLVMLNALALGLEVLQWSALQSDVAVFGHRVLSGAIARSDALGLSPVLLAGLTRLCGADFVQVGGVQGKIFEDDELVRANAVACSSPLGKIAAAVPVSGGGQSDLTAQANADLFGHFDFCHLLGSVAVEDPDGPRAGVSKTLAEWRNITGSA